MRGTPPKRSALRAAAAAVAGLIAAASGCSLLVNRASVQCASDPDCDRFANGSTCELGVCVTPLSDAAIDAPPLVVPEDVPPPPCQTTQDCSPLGSDRICRKRDGLCVSVLSGDCPGPVIGQYASDDAVLIGALLPLSNDVTYGRLGASISNAIRLAAQDFSGDLPPTTDGGPRRPLAVVLCDETVDVDRAARHLRDDLNVPVILGTAFSASTLRVAADVTLAGRELLMTPAAGSDLSSVKDGGLVWRTIPSDRYQAAAIDALVSFLEPSAGGGNADAGAPDAAGDDAGAVDAGASVRVAIVHQADVYGRELDALVTENLRFNGAGAKDAPNVPYFIDEDYGDPDAPQTNQNQLYADAVSGVTVPGSLPDLILLLGYTHAIPNVLAAIEAQWPPGGSPRPRYILSNGLDTTDLLTAIGANDSLRRRILITSPGQSELASVTSGFNAFYRQTFSDGTFPEAYATANAYDAFYAVAYAASAIRNSDPNGIDLVAALRKILTPLDGGPEAGPTPINVGSDSIAQALSVIQAGSPIALHGASGPLAFDLDAGDVVSDVQVWCIGQGSTGPVVTASGLAYSALGARIVGTALSGVCTN